MQILSRIRLLFGFAVLAGALLPAGTAQGQGAKKANSKTVTFNTFDGVTLSGTLYPNNTGKRDAVVLLLHSFDLKKGGSSQQSGWSDLATRLQEEGFVVLSFDFRGFGDSKAVTKEFWDFPQNAREGGLKRKTARPPESIDHKDFNNIYLTNLVNDIAAAKAYLDRRNDAREVNSGNLIVIGAGEGATLGAMWLANECRRYRDTNNPPQFVPTLAPTPEINDVAGAIWLSISPKIGTRTVPLSRWIVAAGKTNKVPMAFVYGKLDTSAGTLAQSYVTKIKASSTKGKKDFQTTGYHPVSGTKLVGNELLQKSLDTENWIVKTYLESVFEGRGSREQKDRKSEASQYYYQTILPGNGRKILGKMSKKAGQEAPQVDVQALLQGQ